MSNDMMDTKSFKKLFSAVATANGFIAVHAGWFQESEECVVVLDLQNSNFGNYFELNIKIFVQGLFGMQYERDKDMVKKHIGDVFLRPPSRYKAALILDNALSSDERTAEIERMFKEFLMPFTAEALTRSGVMSLGASGQVYLLEAVRKQLYCT